MKFKQGKRVIKEGVGAGYTITLEDETRFYSTGYSIDDEYIKVSIDVSNFKDDFKEINAEHPYWDTQYGRIEYDITTPLKSAELILFKEKFFKKINDECTEYYNNYLKKMEKYHQTEKASAEEYLSMSDNDKLNYICETLFKSGCFFEFGKDSKVYRGGGYIYSKLDNPLNIGVSVANFNIFKPNYIFIDFEMYEGKEQYIEGVISFDFEYDSFSGLIDDAFDDYDSYRSKFIEVSDIDWETDDEDADLPDSVEINLYEIADDDKDSDKLESAIIDYLSDEYGFLVKDFNYNVITESKKKDKKVVKENKISKLRQSKRFITESTIESMKKTPEYIDVVNYRVYLENGQPLKEFDDFDEALNYALKNNAFRIEKSMWRDKKDYDKEKACDMYLDYYIDRFKSLKNIVEKINEDSNNLDYIKDGYWKIEYDNKKNFYIISYGGRDICKTNDFDSIEFIHKNFHNDGENREIVNILRQVNFPVTESKRKLKESFMDEYVPAIVTTVNDNLSVEEYFGTLMQSVVETWGLHLNTNKYSEHIALNELYDNLLESVDALIENYKGIYGNIPAKAEVFKPEATNASEYLRELREFVEKGRSLFTDSEILSDIDSILSAIDEALYKVENLTESRKRNRKSVNNILKEGYEDSLLNMYEEFRDEIFNEYNSKEFGYYELRDFINKKILNITDKRRTKKLDEVTRHCINLWKTKKWINDLYEANEYNTYEFLK